MKIGFSRFRFFLEKTEKLMQVAGREENPSLWLFKNNARTVFFMLEGLSKLYKHLHDEKIFDKLQEHFKYIEDGLGKIDYDQFLRDEFSKHDKIPLVCVQYLEQRQDQNCRDLNDYLLDKGWISDDNSRILKTEKRLQEAKWMDEDEEPEAFKSYYRKSIRDINAFVSKRNFHFKDIEADVHELRRDLRWLSIYPQALRGMIQYDEKPSGNPRLKKYLCDEIVNSSYNKMPEQGKIQHPLLLNRDYFLALSWMIAELGKLKDEGLLVTGLMELQESVLNGRENKMTTEMAYDLLGPEQKKIPELLNTAESICRDYFKEAFLDMILE